MRAFLAASFATISVVCDVQPVQPAATGWVAFNITQDGVVSTKYIAVPSWFSGGGGSKLIIPYGGRGHISNTPSLNHEHFYTPNLLGASVEYDVDLSQMDCGCVAAFYLVGMPGKNSSGNYWNTDGFYYCDANQVGGNFCPEFDIMEANQYAYQTTAHNCHSQSDQGFYDDCDRGGTCTQNTVLLFNRQGHKAYGPSNQHTINTLQEFHVKIEFQESRGEFAAFKATMTQRGHSITTTGKCDSNRLMTNDIQKMTFVFSNWGTDSSWLWKESCTGSCGLPTLYIRNIAINSSGASQPTPTSFNDADCANYLFGDPCSNQGDEHCEGSCDCRWFWPKCDPAKWSSRDAACRCKCTLRGHPQCHGF